MSERQPSQADRPFTRHNPLRIPAMTANPTDSVSTKPINDGGPAFHVAATVFPNGQCQPGWDGMTLRDYFAAKAMVGTLAGRASWPVEKSDKQRLAEECFQIANSMLEAREGAAK